MIKLDWDTSFFGFPIFSFQCDRLNPSDYQKLKGDLKLFKKALCYIISKEKVDKESYNDVYQMPSKITLYKLLSLNHEKKNKHQNICRMKLPFEPNSDLIELTYLSGQYSRFRLDPYFSDNDFYRFYRTWIENSVIGGIADECIVYKKEQHILGFLTLKFKGEFAEIGLIAVNEMSQGEGIGRHLIDAAAELTRIKKINKLIVSTQDSNLKACSFYKKNGFIIQESLHYSHLWNSTDEYTI